MSRQKGSFEHLGSLALGSPGLNDSMDVSTPRLNTPQLAFSTTKKKSPTSISKSISSTPGGSVKKKIEFNHSNDSDLEHKNDDDDSELDEIAFQTINNVRTKDKTPNQTKTTPTSKSSSKSALKYDVTIAAGSSDTLFKYPYPIYFKNFLLNELCWPIMLFIDVWKDVFYSEWCLKQGGVFMIMGIVIAATLEVLSGGPRYNLPILLALFYGRYNDNSNSNSNSLNKKSKSMRPHLMLSLIVFVSILLDCVSISQHDALVGIETKVFIGFTILFKLFALYLYLAYKKDHATKKARKFLNRRFRVFLPTCTLPRRLLREIRNRMLALEVLQIVITIFAFTLFIISITSLGYTMSAVNPHSTFGVSMSIFLFIKSISSGLLVMGFLADTDVVLMCAQFGMLGCVMNYVKSYVKEKREEYGGWPLAFFYNPLRFQLLCWGKLADVAWGIVGWVTIVFSIGEDYNNMNNALQRFMLTSIFMLLLSDVYIPILFITARYLTGKHDEISQLGLEADSDDSELDDLGFRTGEEDDIEGEGRGRGKKYYSSGSDSDSDSDDYSDNDSNSNSDSDDVGTPLSKVSRNSSRSWSKSRSRSRSSKKQKKHVNFNSHGVTEDDIEIELYPNGSTDIDASPMIAAAQRLSQDKWGSPYGRVGKHVHTQSYHLQQEEEQYENNDNNYDYDYDYNKNTNSNNTSINNTSEQYVSDEAVFVMNPAAGIASKDFSSLWKQLKVTGHFNCNVQPLVDVTSSSSSASSPYRGNKIKETEWHHTDLVSHLKNQGFFVVAAGKNGPQGCKIYIYAEGLSGGVSGGISDDDKVIYLCQIIMTPIKNYNNNNDNSLQYKLECVSRCTSPDHTVFFVGEFEFSSLFNLLA